MEPTPTLRVETGAGRPPWHSLAVADALAAVGSTPSGLSEATAAERLGRTGLNRLTPQAREPLWRELLESLVEPLQLLLIAVGVLSAIFGELRDAIAIS